MTKMNIPDVFIMKMEDGTPIKMVAMGATVVEKHNGVEFAVVHLLNPKILGEVPEKLWRKYL